MNSLFSIRYVDTHNDILNDTFLELFPQLRPAGHSIISTFSINNKTRSSDTSNF